MITSATVRQKSEHASTAIAMSSFFGLFRGAAAAIGEAMAPLIRTNLEQLIATWRRVDEEYARMLQSKDDALDDSTLVDASRLSELLGQLINVLVVEENECQAAAAQAAATAQAAAAGSSIAALRHVSCQMRQ